MENFTEKAREYVDLWERLWEYQGVIGHPFGMQAYLKILTDLEAWSLTFKGDTVRGDGGSRPSGTRRAS